LPQRCGENNCFFQMFFYVIAQSSDAEACAL
jgi:hypothetical protein